MTVREQNVVNAAIHWWKSWRPSGMSWSDYARDPTCGLPIADDDSLKAEEALARAVAVLKSKPERMP